jgi:Lon protease-like protein
MSEHPFAPGFEELPATVPVFPLPGALLLPGGRLPLNIFEPRYLNMAQDAIATDRLIGMVQPRHIEKPSSPVADLYEVGCAGRITSFTETDDGRLLITLTGLSRFRIEQELPTLRGYRRVVSDWSCFKRDFERERNVTLDRDRLGDALRVFFETREITADWEAIDKAGDEQLITTLSMVCPFDVNEKQALLESDSIQTRGETMITLLEMAKHSTASDDGPRH